jgi:hypothetical protein
MSARNKPVHVQMISRRRDGLSEVEIKKFFRKCKKQGIMDEYLSKTAYALTRSQKKAEKRRKNAFLRTQRRR